MPRKRPQMTRRPRPVQDERIPRLVKTEIERLLRLAESKGKMDWETSCRLRLGEMCDTDHYLTGYVNAVVDCYGIRVDDLLADVREPDGSPVLKRKRSPQSDQIADALGLGAKAGISWWTQASDEMLDAWGNFLRSARPNITEKCLPAPVEEEIAALVTSGKMPDDPEVVAAFRKGWLHSILWAFPEELPTPRPAQQRARNRQVTTSRGVNIVYRRRPGPSG